MAAAGTFLYLHMGRKWETIILICNLTGSWILNTVLKDVFRRARPDIEHLVRAGGYSFPSGHAMISMSFYGMLGYLLYINLRDKKKRRWYVPILTLVIVFSIGLSRIYLGVHYPSDVAAGFAAGGAWLVVCIMSLHTIMYYRSNKK
jgi:undecaprenyl-diphosphatase